MPSIHSIIGRIPGPLKQAIKERVYPELLDEGTLAPEWQLQDWTDKWHRLGKTWTIMVFYPGDDTPGCTKQLQEFQEFYPRLQDLGCQVYGVNPAEASSHRAFSEKYGFDFPILTDRGASVARTYRASLSLPTGPKMIRTVYLVNPDKKIRLANRGAPSVEAIVRSIEALQQATKAGM
ncbi:MAG: peroxiredoxin family protein, partial [Myxococcota bacterium]|nr:peroxiredoxin family protein [Myxococcota bacterium]